MYITNRKEQFSIAYLHAVASRAGFNLVRPDVDNDSIDVQIGATRAFGTVRRAPQIGIQAKCTETDDGQGPHISYTLKLKNYEDLRDENVHLPRILVVLCVPAMEQWLQQTDEQMILRRCAYWVSLRGAAESENDTGQVVHVPRAQLFTVEFSIRNDEPCWRGGAAVKARIRDAATLRAVRPIDVTAYLRATGWTEVRPNTDVTFWEKGSEGVTAPAHQDWRDYPIVVSELIDALSAAENRSQLAILRDLTEVTADVVRLRASADGSDDGSIPFIDGAHLSECGDRMMIAAACAAIEKKRVFGKRKPDRAMDYVQGLRLGQSERGSYVLCILSPVSPALASSQISLEFPGAPPPVSEVQTDPYERVVTTTLGAALTEMERASLRGVATGSMDAFESAVAVGVSADLCDALAILGENRTSFRRVEMRVSWSPARPALEKKPAVASFTPDSIAVIREAGRLLRERSPIDDFEIEGYVRSVSREPTSEQLFGVVEIVAPVEGKHRIVEVELYGDDWEKAHAAIATKAIVRCEGELLRDRRPYFLKKGRNVREVTPAS